MFVDRLKEAAQDGILLLVKYGLIIFVIVYVYLFLMQTRQAAINGEQAAMALNEYIAKGWLPKFPIPEKKE